MTGPNDSLPIIGGPSSDGYRTGSVHVGVADLDGDSANEIVVTWQNASGAFQLTALRYDTTGDTPTLRTVLKPTAMPTPKDAETPLRVAGLTDLVTGDFDGSGHEAIALGWAGGEVNTDPSAIQTQPRAYLSVVRFNAGATGTVKPASQATTSLLPDDKSTFVYFRQGNTIPVSTTVGLKLSAGRFIASESNLHRRQIVSLVQTAN
ncbi:hypothetical protein, partial [Micromonospora sp.]|uniref:hypothetical protein n=1 Tax=Micromonospora sp. TaxID=1876 RepID=UPI003B3B560E